MDVLRRRLTDTPIYYGWIVSGLCFVAFLAIYSINFSFGVFFDFIIDDLDATRATASIAFSAQTASLYISSAVIGTVVGRYGMRRLIVVGTICLGVGMVGASQANSLEALVVTYGIVTGIGMGIIYVIAFTLPSRWFQRRRGIATAIASSGSSVATLLAPPAAVAVIAAIGWQETYLILTAAALVGLAFVAVLAGTDPWSMGVDASHEFPAGNPVSPESTEATAADSARAVFTSASFWLIVVSWIVIYLPFFTLIVHFVAYTTDIGMGRWVGVLAISLLGGMAIPGRLLFGSISDRVGRPKIFVALSFCVGVLIVLLPFMSTPLPLLFVTAVYGLVHGGAGTLVSPLIADFYGSEYVTMLYGVAALSFGIAALAGPYLAGWTVETFGSYAPFLFAIGVAVFAGTGGIQLAAMLEDVDNRLSIP